LRLELLQRAREPRRAGGRADPEQPCRRLAIQLQDDAQRDHLALACRETGERGLERRREPVAEHLLPGISLTRGVGLFSSATPLLRAKVVERGRAGELAQPGLG